MDLIKNQKGSTIILLTFLILTAVLGVVLSASKIVQTGLVLDRTQFESTKAYFAAEAGAERILWAVRQIPAAYDINNECCVINTCCDTECYIPFDGEIAATSDYEPNVCDGDETNNFEKQVLSNDAKYIIKYEYSDPDTTITVTGSYDIVDRRVQLKY